MTVTSLVERVGTRSGSVSYHLKILLRHGYVEDAVDAGRDRRERWFRARSGGLRLSGRELADRDRDESTRSAALNAMLGEHLAHVTRWMRDWHKWPPEWLEASRAADTFLQMTPEELAHFSQDLDALIRRWTERVSDAVAAEPGHAERRTVFILTHAYPETR